MSSEARVVRVREAPPDPSIAKAVGRHHTFETAIADLVDNSIDASAKHVRIRFLECDGAVTGLQVIDDGTGMDSPRIDEAMEFARKRDYELSDLGHFGLGLKAASLSQTDTLNVYSRRHGAIPAGRTIHSHRPTHIEELENSDVLSILEGIRVDFSMSNGTVVEWEGPRTFLTSTDAGDRARWLDNRIGLLKTHLGIVFHRHLQQSRTSISIDVYDMGTGESGPQRKVNAIDPFGYTVLPNDRFPAKLKFSIDGKTCSATAHLWPAGQAGLPEFRLGGRPGSLAQGFYFYRNDRLLQIGGWNTITVDRPELEYVRIEVDIDEALKSHVTINPEKAGLELDSDLRAALIGAAFEPEGISFADFLAAAEQRRSDSRRYIKRPVALMEPGRGMTPTMREAFAESVEEIEAGAVDIRWRVEPSESLVRVDLENRTIWLNSAYRELLSGSDSNDNEDASVIKTLLLIIYSKYFEGSFLGSREKAELEAWDQLLIAAVRDESAKQEKELRDDDDR